LIVLKYLWNSISDLSGFALKYTWLEADDNSHLSVNAFSIWLLANFTVLVHVPELEVDPTEKPIVEIKIGA